MTNITKPIELPRYIPEKVEGEYKIWDTRAHKYVGFYFDKIYPTKEQATAEAKKLNEQTK